LKDKNLSTLDDLAKQKEKKSKEVVVEIQNNKSYNERKEEAKDNDDVEEGEENSVRALIIKTAKWRRKEE
jgi:hypothetical protein